MAIGKRPLPWPSCGGRWRNLVRWSTVSSCRHPRRILPRSMYIAPYVGAAIGEYFMEKGRDVLIIYDDLSKHAVAYRTLSCCCAAPLDGRPIQGTCSISIPVCWSGPGRLTEAYGGGSMTALPIIETLAGDVAAYIPTNVISITDGQIYLENDLFFAGQRPAVNVGLSVSRVGGSAQTKAVKKTAGTLRIDLAGSVNWRYLPSLARTWIRRPARRWTMASASWRFSSSRCIILWRCGDRR